MTVSYHWAPMPNAFVAVDTTEDGIVIGKGHYLTCEEVASLLTSKEAQVESLTRQIDELKAQLAATNTDRVYMVANKVSVFHTPDRETADWFVSKAPPSAGMEVSCAPVLRRPDAERLRLQLIGYADAYGLSIATSKPNNDQIALRPSPATGDVPIFTYKREGEIKPKDTRDEERSDTSQSA